MEHDRNESNPWKLATLLLTGLIAIVLTAGLVIANYNKTIIDEVSPGGAPAYDAPPVPRGGVPAPRLPAKPGYEAPPAPRAAAPAPQQP